MLSVPVPERSHHLCMEDKIRKRLLYGTMNNQVMIKLIKGNWKCNLQVKWYMWYCEVSDWIIVTFFKCRSLKCKDGRKDDVEEQGTHQMWNSKWEIENSVSGNTSNLNNKHTKKSNDFVLYFKCVTNQTKGNNDCNLFHLKWLKWVPFIAYREKKQNRTHPYIIVLLCNTSRQHLFKSVRFKTSNYYL